VIGWVKRKVKPSARETRELSREYQVYRGIFELLKIDDRQGLVYTNPENQCARLCLPEALFKKLFYWAHKHPTAGHFGMSATEKRLRE
jgi:hypothetical protein